eukprot:m.13610 g.13610  ORF g.13610 m.13610 type:complete len:350 (+) comp9788_c0_seq1:152-1201(+)
MTGHFATGSFFTVVGLVAMVIDVASVQQLTVANADANTASPSSLFVTQSPTIAKTPTLLRKGLAHPYMGGPSNPTFTCSDAIAANSSWYYNWSPFPAQCDPRPTAEFVPMISTVEEAQKVLQNISILGPNVSALLGMNEPNAPPINMSVAAAVDAWRTLYEPIAKQADVRWLVSPAAAHCACSGNGCATGGGANDPGGYCNEDWIHEFMHECVGCRIDAIAVHWYPFFRGYNDTIDPCLGSNTSTCVDHLVSYLHSLAVYQKPLWITEFCTPTLNLPPPGDDKAASQLELPFMKAALRAIEALPFVHRASYFAARVGRQDFAGCTLFKMAPNMTEDLTGTGVVWKEWLQ